MSSSPSPENLSPAISPTTSQPLPLPLLSPSSPPPQPPQIISPFPSPLPPSPPDPTATPPPVMSPAAGEPPPPPASSSSSPPAPAPETATAPPPAVLPVSPPSPLISSPPPSPVVASPPPLPPAPKSLPPPPPEPPSPSAAAPPPQAPAQEIPNPPRPSVPQIRPTPPPIPLNTPSPPPMSVVTPSPSSNNSSIASPPPRMDSPQTPASSSSSSPPLPSSFSPPVPSSAANGTLPAAVQIQKPGRSANLSLGFIVGFAAVAFVVVALIFLVVACICQKRRRRRSHPGLPKSTTFGSKDNFTATTLPQHSHLRQPAPIKNNAAIITSWIESESNIPSPPQSNFPTTQGIFTYDQLVVATNGFSASNLIGEGGFGYVYKGVLTSGKEVAVKQLRTGSWQGEREFQAEVDIISRVHHKHLVSLVGYCITGAERLLVYEFVPNNTLEFHLHGEQQEAMEWATRLKIAIGSAKGLAYLHEDCNPKIIHRDIKASNILLDFRFEAKVSDFGLAKSFSDTSSQISHISTRVVGSFGYLAPEYASSGKVTEKSDVYSYGVVLLELITGRPPISSIDPIRNQSLVEWASPLLAQALEDGCYDTLVDPRLQRNYDAVEMSRMISCAAACVRHSAWLRPRMIQIVHALEGHTSLTDLREGITPGSSTVYSFQSSSYNAHQYKNDLNKFHIAIADQENGSTTYSGSTSEYGLNPSVSSSEAHQTLRN